jgi:ribosome biogenesis protein BRX1
MKGVSVQCQTLTPINGIQIQVMKQLLQQIIVTPKGHQKSKPFFDHVISFTYCDNRIWLRNYQVVTTLDKKQARHEGVTLIEVGPRLTLQPIKVCAQQLTGDPAKLKGNM